MTCCGLRRLVHHVAGRRDLATQRDHVRVQLLRVGARLAVLFRQPQPVVTEPSKRSRREVGLRVVRERQGLYFVVAVLRDQFLGHLFAHAGLVDVQRLPLKRGAHLGEHPTLCREGRALHRHDRDDVGDASDQRDDSQHREIVVPADVEAGEDARGGEVGECADPAEGAVGEGARDVLEVGIEERAAIPLVEHALVTAGQLHEFVEVGGEALRDRVVDRDPVDVPAGRRRCDPLPEQPLRTCGSRQDSQPFVACGHHRERRIADSFGVRVVTVFIDPNVARLRSSGTRVRREGLDAPAGPPRNLGRVVDREVQRATVSAGRQDLAVRTCFRDHLVRVRLRCGDHDLSTATAEAPEHCPACRGRRHRDLSRLDRDRDWRAVQDPSSAVLEKRAIEPRVERALLGCHANAYSASPRPGTLTTGATTSTVA